MGVTSWLSGQDQWTGPGVQSVQFVQSVWCVQRSVLDCCTVPS